MLLSRITKRKHVYTSSPMSTASRTYPRLLRTPAYPQGTPLRRPLPLPQWPLLIPQRRTLLVYPLTRLKTINGAHKALTLHRYEAPNLAGVTQRINLFTDKGELIAKDITFQQACDHISPGKILCPVELPKSPTLISSLARIKENDVPGRYNNYQLWEPNMKSIKVDSKFDSFRGHLKIKTIPLSGKRMKEVDHFKQIMKKAYGFMCMKHPIEMNMLIPGQSASKGPKRSIKYSLDPELNTATYEDWQYLHKHWPHLHPDIIIKSMPEGSSFWLSPWTDGIKLYWVIGPPHTEKLNLDKKLQNIKAKVRLSIQEGKQQELPKAFRQQLMEQGLIEYTPESGTPRARENKALSRHEIQMQSQDMKYRYMVPGPHKKNDRRKK